MCVAGLKVAYLLPFLKPIQASRPAETLLHLAQCSNIGLLEQQSFFESVEQAGLWQRSTTQ